MYSEENPAATVTERHPIIPYVQDYKVIIEEVVEAHFCGLTSLLPCLAPNPTSRSRALAVYWRNCSLQSEKRPSQYAAR